MLSSLTSELLEELGVRAAPAAADKLRRRLSKKKLQGFDACVECPESALADLQ